MMFEKKVQQANKEIDNGEKGDSVKNQPASKQHSCEGLNDLKPPDTETLISCLAKNNIKETVDNLPGHIASTVESLVLDREYAQQEHYSKQIEAMWKGKNEITDKLSYGDAREFKPDTFNGKLMRKYMFARLEKEPHNQVKYTKDSFEEIPAVQEILEEVKAILGPC